MPTMPPTHRPWGRRSEAERRREYDRERGSASARGYGRRWQRVSKGYLRAHPLCVTCEAEGVVEAATVVDHVRAHRGDMALFWDSTNWQSLCKPCHDRKTAREVGFAGGVGAGQKSRARRS